MNQSACVRLFNVMNIISYFKNPSACASWKNLAFSFKYFSTFRQYEFVFQDTFIYYNMH